MNGVRLVVGLGNPGASYEKTRHNVGFMVVDRLAAARGVSWRTAGQGMIGEDKELGIWLLKPLTFMNRSGLAVAPFARRHGIEAPEILVVADDLDLPLGTVRLRMRGSAGGHNGLKSIIEALGSEEFGRLRVGIGRPQAGTAIIDWVLGRPQALEWEVLRPAIARAALALEVACQKGLAEAMNQYNRRPDAWR